jgi:hypothetical protein
MGARYQPPYSSRMASRLRVVVAALALLLVVPGVALGGQIGVGQGAPPNKVIRFTGSESAGAVSFRLLIWSGPGLPTSRAVGMFTFADPCAASGMTRISARIPLGTNLRFNRLVHGVRVSGGLNKKLTQAGGSVRVIRVGCDTGSLHFTAKPIH